LSDRLDGATVAVIGFGNQGEAQATVLMETGVTVIVGARRGGAGEARARSLGLPTHDPIEALRRATIAAILLPDEALPDLWPALAAGLPDHARLVFAHGFNLLYSDLAFPAGADVVLVSPAGPGFLLARARAERAPIAAYLAVHRDASGGAWALAESYARRLGCAPLWRTTVREETEVDLFGEQVALCGGLNALTLTAFEVLVAHGYSEEMAYLECVHQIRYLAELLNQKGPAGFRRAISGTALFGDLTRGPRVIGEASRHAMETALEQIRSGAFAREWRAEVEAGRSWLEAEIVRAARHPIEEARRRALGSDPDQARAQESRNTLSKD
jgi:ketol-acid reductoisomerase